MGGQTAKSRFFAGLIDEVQFINRALSAAEIEAIYQAGTAGMIKSETELKTGEWITRSPVPTSRGALVAQPLADGIHVIGGSNKTESGWFQFAAHEVYDPTTDNWSAKAPAPDLGMWAPASAVVSGKLFVIGGWPEHHAALRLYDPQLDTWEYKASIPDEGFSWGHTAAVVGVQIYVIGGYNGIGDGDQPDPKVLRYDPRRDVWTGGLAPIPINEACRADGKCDGLAASVIEGKVYVVGTGKHLQIYDPATDAWSQGESLPISTTEGPGVVAMDGELYVFGGWNSSECGRDVQIYNPKNNEWRLGKQMTTGRCYLAVALHSGNAYVFGGFDRAWRAVDTNEQFSP